MKILPLTKAFTLIEPGPVVLVATNDGRQDNVMTISWTMVLDFSAMFAIATGPWNYSYAALRDAKECVIAIPTVDMLDTAVGVGTCSGKDTDKFEKFGLTRAKAKHVRAPLIKECLANIECRVVDIVERPRGATHDPRRRRRHIHRRWAQVRSKRDDAIQAAERAVAFRWGARFMVEAVLS